MGKVVCFAGHRYDWQNVGVEEKLEDILCGLIEKGYTTFYDGGKGYFDTITANAVISLKIKYPQIKIYKILSCYYPNKDKGELSPYYDGSILPDIESYHPKLRITKRNEWIVDNCDVLVCHIVETYKSGAYNTLKYAHKVNKPIVYI